MYDFDDTVLDKGNKKKLEPFSDPWIQHALRYGIGSTCPPPDEACKEVA